MNANPRRLAGWISRMDGFKARNCTFQFKNSQVSFRSTKNNKQDIIDFLREWEHAELTSTRKIYEIEHLLGAKCLKKISARVELGLLDKAGVTDLAELILRNFPAIQEIKACVERTVSLTALAVALQANTSLRVLDLGNTCLDTESAKAFA